MSHLEQYEVKLGTCIAFPVDLEAEPNHATSTFFPGDDPMDVTRYELVIRVKFNVPNLAIILSR